jgi:GDPmannose 4,6-dehydratase
LNVLEAVKRHSPDSRVFLAGSGVQFKNKGLPIKETDEFEANSPYSVARIHSVYAARYYRTLGLHVYVGYLFHHESPLRKPNHVSQKIALAVKRIAEGSDEVIELGDISVEKEWTFAGDVARGIMTLVEQNDVFEAVIGSGIGYTIENWLEQCFRIIGKDWHDHVRLCAGFVPEYERLISNPQTINSLGWFPNEGFPDLAKRMVMQRSQ